METDAPPIWARGLVRRFGSLVAVAGLDLETPRSTCLALLGPNGAGKTTTLEMLIGLLPPDAGDIRILGLHRPGDWPKIRERIGVQLQETRLLEKLTVRETLRLFGSLYETRRPPAEVERIVGLEEKTNARVATLSGGQRQRLTLGCAIVNRPAVLFLDEPTTGLDPQARRRVWDIVREFKEEGGTVLLTTHFMQEAEELADHVVIVDHGKAIARGTPAELIRSLGAESVIEFRIGEGAPPGSAEVLVESLGESARPRTASDGTFTAEVVDAKVALVSLLERSKERGIPIEDLRTHRATLEDVFLSKTGRQLRDS